MPSFSRPCKPSCATFFPSSSPPIAGSATLPSITFPGFPSARNVLPPSRRCASRNACICGDRLFSAQLLMGDGRCQNCRDFEPEFARAVSFGEYEGGLRGLVHLLKYESVLPVAPVLGGMLASAIVELLPGCGETRSADCPGSAAQEQAQRARIQPGGADRSCRGKALAATGRGRDGSTGSSASDHFAGGTHPRRAYRQHERCISRSGPAPCEGPHRDRRGRRHDHRNHAFRVCPRAEEGRGRTSLGSDRGPRFSSCALHGSCQSRG